MRLIGGQHLLLAHIRGTLYQLVAGWLQSCDFTFDLVKEMLLIFPKLLTQKVEEQKQTGAEEDIVGP